MGYELLGRSGAWVQWIDRGAAAGWAAELARLAANPPPDDATAASWPAQKAWTLAAYRAIAGMAGAIDCPIPSFEPWARQIRAADQGPHLGGAWYAAARPRVARTVDLSTLNVLRLYHRVWISADGDVGEAMDALQCPDDFIRCRDRVDNDCAVSGGTFGATGWTCMAWDVCTPSGPGGGEVGVMIPLQWSAMLAREAIDAMLAAPTLGDIVQSCRAYVAERNAATVEAVAATDPRVMDEADVIASAAAARARVLRGEDGTEVIAGVGEAVHDAAPSPVTAAIEGLTALPRLLMDLFGRARAYDVDLWGRELPLIETAAQSGYLDPPRAPTRRAPTPPGGAIVYGTLAPEALTFPVYEVGTDTNTHPEQWNHGVEDSGPSPLVIVGAIALLLALSGER